MALVVKKDPTTVINEVFVDGLIGEDIALGKSTILSELEMTVLFALANGNTPTEIKKLISSDSIALRNVEINIMRKLEAKTKVHIITKAFSKGLLLTHTLQI
jgi:DNA-binding CsgD family transcriptional regulator